MVSKFFSPLLLLAGHLGLSYADPPSSLFVGKGQLLVVNSSDWSNVDLANKIGCISDTGAFTLDDCGVFTKIKDDYGLSSRLGNCTFSDSTQPANTDAIYGQSRYALVCKKDTDPSLFYSFSNTVAKGTNLPIVFHGNLDGYGDVKGVPAKGQKLSFWEFAWGSDQFDVPEGHIKTVWVWQPV